MSADDIAGLVEQAKAQTMWAIKRWQRSMTPGDLCEAIFTSPAMENLLRADALTASLARIRELEEALRGAERRGVERAADVFTRHLDDIYVRDGFCDWADVATARDEAAAILSLPEGVV